MKSFISLIVLFSMTSLYAADFKCEHKEGIVDWKFRTTVSTQEHTTKISENEYLLTYGHLYSAAVRGMTQIEITYNSDTREFKVDYMSMPNREIISSVSSKDEISFFNSERSNPFSKKGDVFQVSGKCSAL